MVWAGLGNRGGWDVWTWARFLDPPLILIHHEFARRPQKVGPRTFFLLSFSKHFAPPARMECCCRWTTSQSLFFAFCFDNAHLPKKNLNGVNL